MLLCQRYIELNPVRAGMVDDPAQYRWSSYRANGLGQPDDLLTPHAVYLALGKGGGLIFQGKIEPDLFSERQTAYRALFRPELECEALADIRLALSQGQPLGSARFLDQVERMVGRCREVRPRGRPRKRELLESSTGEQQALTI